MDHNFGDFETIRFPYIATQVLIGWVMTGWAFMVWCFNVFILKKSPFGKFKGTMFWNELSPALRCIRAGSAGWQSLHIIYNWYGHFGLRPNLSRDPLAWFWNRILNAQAVRNRLRIIVLELKRVILDVSSREDEVRIFSIASGSAQSLFLAVKALKKEGFNKPIKFFLLDLDHTALEYSLGLAKNLGIPEKDIIVANSSTTSSEKLIERNRFMPHIIEMAGFLDYRPDRKAISLMKMIHQMLPKGGWFITCHIHPNMEQTFIRYVLCWPMIYRKKKEFLRLVQKSASWEIRFITEPHGIHTVAVCRKPNET